MAKQVYDYTSLLSNFTQNMRSERIKKGWSQKKLADLVGVTKQTILNYENQKTIPSSHVMESVALALDVSLESLIGDDIENTKRIKIAERIEKMDTNPDYKRLVKEEKLLEELYEFAKFKKSVAENQMTDTILDELIGGKLNKTTNEKIRFIQTEKELAIHKAISDLDTFYQEHLSDIAYRFED
ncbi:helix-turn-helix domain-containing protein [Erwinia sp. CPCC 100877]|nr:helix-turn-helix domain-containing protein [Erwinia sp. CPCC 100877]